MNLKSRLTTSLAILCVCLVPLARISAESRPRALHGREAVDALGSRIGELAARSGFGSAKELERMFLTDSTLHVDLSTPQPMLLYIDTALPPTPSPAGSSPQEAQRDENK